MVKPWALFPEQQKNSYQMHFQTFLKNWSATKYNPTVTLDDSWQSYMVQDCETMKVDRSKCKLLAALHDAYASQPLDLKKLALTHHPTGVRATAEILNNELVFVPLVPMKHMEAIKWNAAVPSKSVDTKLPVILQDSTMLKLVLNKPPGISQDDQLKFTGFVSLYWAIRSTSDMGSVNMKASSVEVDGIVIPTLSTSRTISKFEELLKYEAEKEKPQQMRGCVVVTRTRVNGKRSAGGPSNESESESKRTRA